MIHPVVRTTGPEDEGAVRALLEAGGLQAAEDLQDLLPTTLVAEIDGVVVGCGAFEDLGELALLRSFVVAEEFRGLRIGTTLLRHIEGTARYMGFTQAFLLTETARKFFAARGWRDLPRDQAPDPVRATGQFSTLCPESAALMTKVLAAPSPVSASNG